MKLPDKKATGRRQFLNLAGVVAVGAAAGPHAAFAAQKPPWQADGAGMARVGLLVPSFDFNPESELWAMAPSGVAVFASRMDRGTLPFRTYLSDPSHADAALGLLTVQKLRVVLYAYTTTSYVMGLTGEESFRARLVTRAQGTPVVLAVAALCEALHVLEARRPALVHPPWFPEEQSEMGRAYFSARGFQVASCSRILPARPTQIEMNAEDVHSWIVANTPPNADAVVVAGNGLRAVGTIEALEASLGRPVVTANQALLWQGLRVAGAPTGLDHYGRLFKVAGK